MPKEKSAPHTAPKPTLEAAGIRESEWSMWKNCPEGELEECLVYECLRRTTLWPLLIGELRKLGDVSEYIPQAKGWARIHDFLCLFPEFPKSPWLDIPEKRRAARLKQLAARCHRWGPVESADQGAFVFPPPIAQQHELGGPYWEKGFEVFAKYRSRSIDDPGFNHLLHIDWIRTDEEIAAAFRKWLKTARPADYATYQRHGTSIFGAAAFRKGLKSIGAHVLVQRVDSEAQPPLLLKDAAEQALAGVADLKEHIYRGGKELRNASKKLMNYVKVFELEYTLFHHRSVAIQDCKTFRFVPEASDYSITQRRGKFVRVERRTVATSLPICRTA